MAAIRGLEHVEVLLVSTVGVLVSLMVGVSVHCRGLSCLALCVTKATVCLAVELQVWVELCLKEPIACYILHHRIPHDSPVHSAQPMLCRV